MYEDKDPTRPHFVSLESKPLDPIFHSDYEERPFSRCIECDEAFVAEDALLPYSIMKAFVHTETIVELAICWNCQARWRDEISRESKQSISEFLEGRFRPLATIESCALCSRKRENCRAYSVYACCIRQEVVGSKHPFMICDTCEEAMQELLSDETRGWQGDFMDRHFSGPSLEADTPVLPVLV